MIIIHTQLQNKVSGELVTKLTWLWPPVTLNAMMNYRSIIWDDKYEALKITFIFPFTSKYIIALAHFQSKVFPFLLWLKLKLRQIIFSSIPWYVSFFSPPPLKVARSFSFCRCLSHVVSRDLAMFGEQLQAGWNLGSCLKESAETNK